MPVIAFLRHLTQNVSSLLSTAQYLLQITLVASTGVSREEVSFDEKALIVPDFCAYDVSGQDKPFSGGLLMGKVNQNVEPSPGALSTPTCP